MRVFRYSRLPYLLVFSLSWGTAFADAESSPKERDARALFESGVEMSTQERWAEAERLFARADALVPRASTAYNRALALYRLGRARETVAALDQFLERSDADRDASDRAEAAGLRERALASLATLVVEVTPPNAQVQVDTEILGGESRTRTVRVDPGEHSIAVQAPGFTSLRRDLSVSASEEKNVELTLSPEAPATPPVPLLSPGPPPPPVAAPVPIHSSSHEAAWVLIAVGGATVAAAAVTGTLALSLDSQIASKCKGSACPLDQRSEQDRLNTLATTTDVLWVTGSVLAGTGVAWYFLSRSTDGAAAVRATLSPAFLTVEGEF